jgi:hypothetical protein
MTRQTKGTTMTDLLNTLTTSAPLRAVPHAMLAVFDGFTQDPVRDRLITVQKDMSRALPRTRLFRF